MKLKNCKECGKEISKNEKTCPSCGANLKSTYASLAGIFAGLSFIINPFGILSILGIVFGFMGLFEKSQDGDAKGWALVSIIFGFITAFLFLGTIASSIKILI